MVIDTSALLAVVFAEADAERIFQLMKSATTLAISAGSLFEAGIPADARGYGDALDTLVEYLAPQIVAVDEKIAARARQAYRQYGRGRHAAELNFGDCLSYATAKHLRLPLLFKGDDFRLTDVQAVEEI